MRGLLTFLLLLFWQCAAHAEWIEASSPHFVIYADADPAKIQGLSQELERYHSAMAYVSEKEPPPPSPSNRLTIFIVENERNVQELHNARDVKLDQVGGFYVPRAGSSFAIVPLAFAEFGGSGFDLPKMALLHEYAHHFMMSANAVAMPLWYAEGGAEFFASAKFWPDGGVSIGRPAHQHTPMLSFASVEKVATILDPAAQNYSTIPKRSHYYGKSWLLFHYMTFEEGRKGQLARYLRLFNEGKNARDAGIEAFGDFAKLESDLDAYVARPRLLSFRLPPEMLRPKATVLRTLRPGEAAAMPTTIRIRTSAEPAAAAAFVNEARAVAARFPSDPAVQTALAEAESVAGNHAEAIAAADAALAIDQSLVSAHIFKGVAQFDIASKNGDLGALSGVRETLAAASRLESDHPVPLLYIYLTYRARSRIVPDEVLNSLERATKLAPYDFSFRLAVARLQLEAGQKDAAKANLRPIALSPHNSKLVELAQKHLARMDAEPDWDGRDFLEEPPL